MVSGEKIGPYTIIDKLGEGGMGQVWRATDSTLGRHSRRSIIRTSPRSTGLRNRRGCNALVMELVEEEDLSQRIARGAIPLGEALPMAKQIAEALEAAHEQGSSIAI